MKMYHGSKKIVTMPICDHKSVSKDFGPGFYATGSEELAREWASQDENGGFINIYELETDSLDIIDLISDKYSVLNWLALVLSERKLVFYSKAEKMNSDSIIRRYLPDVSGADIIKGYRTDDAFLVFCRAFIEEKIDKEQLIRLTDNADLGEELVIRTERAMKNLTYLGFETVDGSLYYPKRLAKEIRAMELLREQTDKHKKTSGKDSLTHPYPELYLTYSMKLLGELTGCAASCMSSFPEMTPDRFLQCFIISGYASCIESGDPRVILGLTGSELYIKVLSDCGMRSDDLLKEAPEPDESDIACWCGEMLAFYQWYRNISFSDLVNSLSYGRLFALYPELHLIPKEEAAVIIDQKLGSRRSASTRLQAHRKRLGLSQRELAEASGVNLRTLQQYEVGDKDIGRAAAEKVISLSRILHCRPDHLLE